MLCNNISKMNEFILLFRTFYVIFVRVLAAFCVMNKRQIEHRGVVESILPHTIVVSIAQETACAACAAATLCHSSDKQEKKMEIACQDSSSYRVGQEVTIVGSMGLGLRATLWAYIVPLVVLMAVLITASRLTGNEGLGAVIALLSLFPYYILLFLFRNKLQRRFQFQIKSINP